MENFPGNTDAKNSDIAIQYCLVPLEESSEFCVCLEYEWQKRDTYVLFGKTDYTTDEWCCNQACPYCTTNAVGVWEWDETLRRRRKDRQTKHTRRSK